MQKYKLPANHALFLQQSQAELMLEMYEDLFQQRDTLRDAIDTFDASGAGGSGAARHRDKLLESINAINQALGLEEEVYDAVIDKWERDLAEGRIPNLRER